MHQRARTSMSNHFAKKGWHQLSLQELLVLLGTTTNQGLSSAEVSRRHMRYGFNIVQEPEEKSWTSVFINQCKSPFLLLLLLAALFKFILEGYRDALIILIIIFVNIFIGAVQEGRAQRILLSIKKFLKTSCIVLRNGKKEIVDAYDIVPGDIIIVQEGSRVPADARLTYVADLLVDESMLTGESKGVRKSTATLPQNHMALLEQHNMLFMGTHILSGSATAIVVAIGAATEIGKLQKNVETVSPEMPLKKDLDLMAYFFLVVSTIVAVTLLTIGVLRGYNVSQMLFTLTSLFVSIVPENLSIIFTIVLAAGAYRMALSHVLIKNLPIIEALGRIQVLIVDKTGTLTRNEQMVVAAFVEDAYYTVTGSGYLPDGAVFFEGQKIYPSKNTALLQCARAAALFDYSHVHYDQESHRVTLKGDPLQAALGTFAKKLGFDKDELHKEYRLVSEVPFKATSRMSSFTYDHHGKLYVLQVGSPEKILEICSLEAAHQAQIQSAFKDMLHQGLRVVAIAHDGIFLGLIGMQDALRADVTQTVGQVKAAGLKIVMATGDHPDTALYVGRETGIFEDNKGDTLIVGSDFYTLEDQEMNEKLTHATILARVAPEDKLRIISAYRRLGKIVGMTGDGVNDVPALVAADVGIAMGVIGSEIAQDAADVVLLDDSLSSIIAGITEGRHIIATLRRVILFLLVENTSEASLIALSVIFGLPLPVLALQLLWQHLLTDSFLGIGLSMESIEHRLLPAYDRPPILIDKTLFSKMAYMALPVIVGTFGIFLYYLPTLELARTMVVVTFAFFQWFNAWNLRSEEASIFSVKLSYNIWLALLIFVSFIMQILVIHVPYLREALHFVQLSVSQWFLAAAVGFSIVIVEEIRKFFGKKINQ